jgi:hypothetical protein
MPDNFEDTHGLGDLAAIARRVEALTLLKERHEEMIREGVREAVAIEARVRILEAYAQTRAVTEAREDERDKALYERLTRMEDQIKETRGEIKEIKGLGGRALWIVGSVVLTAIVAWVIKGGLA